MIRPQASQSIGHLALHYGAADDAMVLEFNYVFPGRDGHILSVVEL